MPVAHSFVLLSFDRLLSVDDTGYVLNLFPRDLMLGL